MLPYWSPLMGFDTLTLTQDSNELGYFGLQMHFPIPMFKYGDSYDTWSKYGFITLNSDLKCRYTS